MSIKIVFFGTPAFVVPVLQVLQENFEVVAVITSPDQRVGRKQIITPSPVKLASPDQVWEAGRIYTPEKLDQEVTQKLQKLQPDLFIVAAYGKIIPQNILDIPKYGALNIHPSLLPKYRGPSPIQSAILNGDKTTGITIIKMDEKMDHGPIIYTKQFSLSDQDNFDSLSKKVFKEATTILPSVISDFVKNKIKPMEQNHDMSSYCSIVKKEDGYFDLPIDGQVLSKEFLEKLDRMIRAYFPWPNAWTRWNNKIIKFLPGGLVQMEGKKPVKLADFLNGYPNFPLKKL